MTTHTHKELKILYTKLEKENIDKPMIEYSLLTEEEIKDYLTDREDAKNFTIDNASLKRLNFILKIIFDKLVTCENVFVMTQFLTKHFGNKSTLVNNTKSNIAAKSIPRTTHRTAFELYNEIFGEIVETEIKQMFISKMKSYLNINVDDIEELIETAFKNNTGLSKMYESLT